MHQRRVGAAGPFSHFLEALGVRRIGRADHDQSVDIGGHAFDRLLAIGGGVADVLFVRPDDRRKALLEQRDDLGSVVHRKRGLRNIGEPGGIARNEGRRVREGLDQGHGAGRQLPDRADHLGMSGMADQRDLVAAAVMDFRLAMDLGDERTGRVEREHMPPLRLVGHRFRNTVGGEDDRRRRIGDFGKVLDEDRAFRPQGIDDVAVVNDFVAHVDRRAVHVQGPFHGLDRAHYAGAEAARRAQEHAQFRLRRERRDGGLGGHGGTGIGADPFDMGRGPGSVKHDEARPGGACRIGQDDRACLYLDYFPVIPDDTRLRPRAGGAPGRFCRGRLPWPTRC